MRLGGWFLLVAIILFPSFIQGEVLVLKDGSTLNGTLVALRGDTLVFKTSFGSVIHIAKKEILRLEFSAHPGAAARNPALDSRVVPPASSEPGTLRVDCSEISLSTRIVVHRRRDREGHVRANSIEEALLVGGVKVYSYVDSITDKTIKEGPDETLKNTIDLKSINVGLPAGSYNCQLVIRNMGRDEYADRFDPEPLARTVMLDNILIEPGRTTSIKIIKKRKTMGLRGSELLIVR